MKRPPFCGKGKRHRGCGVQRVRRKSRPAYPAPRRIAAGISAHERTPHGERTRAKGLPGDVREKSVVSRSRRTLPRYSLGAPTPGRLNITAFRRLPSVTGRSNWGCKNSQDQKLLNPDMLGKPAPEPRRQVRSQGLENDIIQFCGICLDLQELKKSWV